MNKKQSVARYLALAHLRAGRRLWGPALALLAAIAAASTAAAQTTGRLTVANHCSFPIWLQLENNSDTPGVPILPKTPPDGAANILPLAAGEGPLTIAIPDVGWAGRFFPKLGCNPQTGNDCQGGQALTPCPAGGCQPPATTKIEFNYANLATSRDSWYDISLVDGYNLAARITPRGRPAGRVSPPAARCPSPPAPPTRSTGSAASCSSRAAHSSGAIRRATSGPIRPSAAWASRTRSSPAGRSAAPTLR